MSYKKILVIPSVREECLANFFKAWDKVADWDHVIVVEDNPGTNFDWKNILVNMSMSNKSKFDSYSWQEINETLGESSWIISKRDSAIRCFGFLMAYRAGADYILTLDDDCYPHDDEPIFDKHIKTIESYSKWTTSLSKTRTRGYPYKNFGNLSSVVANMGFWTKVPDFDAVQSLVYPEWTDFHPGMNGYNRIIPAGQYFPLCGMNLCFKREVTPLCYFPLMGLDQPYARFDDIWFGIIFKKIIDHLGMQVSVGEPFVEHQKASDVFVNLKKEAPGIGENETFWEKIDKIALRGRTPIDCMIEIGYSLESYNDKYIEKLGTAIKIWASLFEYGQ